VQLRCFGTFGGFCPFVSTTLFVIAQLALQWRLKVIKFVGVLRQRPEGGSVVFHHAATSF
jgi:hypothetical protein